MNQHENANPSMSENMKAFSFVRQILSQPDELAASLVAEGSGDSFLPPMVGIAIAGFAIHGLVLGSGRPGLQTVASTLKAPLVPILSLLITTPLLHTFSLSVGGTWGLHQTIGLAFVPLAVTALLLAASSPLLLFFGATSDYHFAKILHVGVTAVFSLYGVLTLLRVLQAMDGPSTALFAVWVLVFFFVSAQMAWILRPFIGSPDRPFRWIAGRDNQLNFYTAVALSLLALLTKRSRS